jgi:competence protein ComEA
MPRAASSAEIPSETATNDGYALRVEINTASTRELEKLPGIGKSLAERIVAYREEHGPFRRVEHLMMVPGISERKFRELQPLVRVE